MINKIILGHALNVLPKLPAESVSCVTTSPPYWGLRDYGIEPVIWDGDKDCKHEWVIEECKAADDRRGVGKRWQHKDAHYPNENPESYPNRTECYKHKVKIGFCSKCGAWRGSLGLEPTFELYIKHLCDIFDEIKRVLRKDGTCFVNIGDTYAGGGGWTGVPDDWESLSTDSKQKRFDHNKKNISIPAKSLCDIPYRFSIEMTNRGWIKRNTIIWHKLNCMPSSADDRFTVDFEYLFFFTKNNKAIFWTNEKTLECVDKNPPGTKGIKGKDWEWQPCPACSNKNYFNYRTWDVMKKEKGCPQFKAIDKEKENIKNKICPRCKGLKKVKYSFWTGHDYWFEQQFEKSIDIESYTGRRPRNAGIMYDLDRKNYQMAGNINKNGKFKNTGKTYPNRNKRCVWIIPTQPFPEAHFAVYPEGLIEIPIKAGCPEFICKKCGKARVKIYDNSERVNTRPGNNVLTAKSGKEIDPNKELHKSDLTKYRQQIKHKEIGYSDCGCNAGWESGINLDPFMGAGTSALVALKQRKRFIGIEIKQSYIDMSYKRIAKVQQRIFLGKEDRESEK